jgi:type IV pilus assembly protein PilQ
MKINSLPQKIILQLVIFLFFHLSSATALAVNLINMKVSALSNNSVEIELKFDDKAPLVKDYSFPNIPSIAIDLMDTNTNIKKYNDVKTYDVNYIQVREDQEKTRVLVGLNQQTKYYYKTEHNTITLFIGVAEDSYTSCISNEDNKAISDSKLSLGVTKIDFKKNEQGNGLVVIDLDDNIAVNTYKDGNKVYLEFDGDIIPLPLRNRYDVNDFNTPVSIIDSSSDNKKSFIIIEMKQPYEYFVFQANNQLTINISQKESQYLSNNKSAEMFSGNKIDLNFQDVDIRSVLQIIADFNKFNLVVSDAVTGKITLHLDQVPWDQALDIVMKTKGLDKRIKDNIMLVAPIDELTAREKSFLETTKQLHKLEPIITDVINIKYSEADEIAKMLTGETNKKNSFLSEDGSIQVVPRTNSLLIKESYSKIEEIRKLINDIDIPNKQIMIETRIVTVNSSFKKDLGFKWGFKSKRIDIGSNRDVEILGAGRTQSVAEGEGEASPNVINNLFTDLAVSGSGFGINLNGLNAEGGTQSLLGLQISAALADGGGETLSEPKVFTTDKTEAVIKSGRQIPYETESANNGKKVSFKDAVLSLKVKPQVTPDKHIILDIKITNDNASKQTYGTGAPAIDTNEISTRVSVENGETLALGGVFIHTNDSGVEKVPFLSSIPIIGNLFKRTTKGDTKKEILIFITPTIVDDRLNVSLKGAN